MLLIAFISLQIFQNSLFSPQNFRKNFFNFFDFHPFLTTFQRKSINQDTKPTPLNESLENFQHQKYCNYFETPLLDPYEKKTHHISFLKIKPTEALDSDSSISRSSSYEKEPEFIDLYSKKVRLDNNYLKYFDLAKTEEQSKLENAQKSQTLKSGNLMNQMNSMNFQNGNPQFLAGKFGQNMQNQPKDTRQTCRYLYVMGKCDQGANCK